jgi:hypothetical protein
LIAAVLVAAVIGALWCLPGPRTPKLLGQSQEVSSTSATISWRTSSPCFSLVEYWPGPSGQRNRSRPESSVTEYHEQVLTDLKSGTSYSFQLLHASAAGGDYRALSPVEFVFVTDAAKPVTGKEKVASSPTTESVAAGPDLGEMARSAAHQYSKMTPEERQKAIRSVQEFVHAGAPSSLGKDRDPGGSSGADFNSRMDALKRRVEEFRKKGVDVDHWLKNKDVEQKIRELEQSKSIEQLDEIAYALDHVDENRIRSFLASPEEPPPLPSLESGK